MKIKRIISACFRIVLNVLTFIIPKKKGMLLLVPLHNPEKITGNIKALFDYGTVNEPDFELIYWTQTNRIYNWVHSKNNKIIKGGAKLTWYSLRAEHIIIIIISFNF